MSAPPFQTPTLREAVAYWLTHVAPARTRDQYATLLRVHWLPAFGDVALDRITAADVAAVLERLRATHTAGTVETIRKALATAFYEAARAGWIAREANPAARRSAHRLTLEPPPEGVPTAAWTVRDYSRSWLEITAACRKPWSTRCYRTTLRRHVWPILGTLRLDELTRPIIRRALLAHATAGCAPATIRAAGGVLAACLNAAVDDELLTANPASQIGRHLPRTPRAGMPPRAMDRIQLQRFLTVAATDAPDFSAYFLLLARAGLREAEGLGLLWTDLDLDGGLVRLDRQWRAGGVADTLKSARSARVVHLTPQLVACLRERRRAHPTDSWVFQGSKGSPWCRQVVQRAMRRLCVRAGLPRFRVHDLRHTCASQLLAAGAPPQYVQRMLGHSSIAITVGVYGSWLPLERPAVLDRLDSPDLPTG